MSKTILIAGGTDGIGLAFLKECLRSKEWGKVYVLGRNFSSVRKLRNKRVVEVVCDVTDEGAIGKSLKVIGQLDVFVNTIGSFQKKPVSELTIEDIKRHVNLNTTGNMILTRLVLPKLRKSFSQILVCLATLAVEPRESYAMQSATKASYRFFLECLRKEVADRVRIMLIHPSSVQTKIFEKAGDKRDYKKYPKPEVIAQMMSFLISQPPSVEIRELLVHNR